MTNGEKIREVFDGMTDKQKEIVQAMTDEDNINPNHYKSETSLECIEAMQIAFGNDAVIDFCLCNAWKYIWRWKNKNGVEDLKKAEWYVEKGRELLGNRLELFESTDTHQRFDSMADYINSHLKEEKIIMEKEEILTVTFCSYDDGEAGLAVLKKPNSNKGTKPFIIKLETGEQAYDLYYLLTNQSAKVEDIKVNKSESGIKISHIQDTNISKSMCNSIKGTLQEAQHTCGRCKHEHKLEDEYPCNACVYGTDARQDLWEEKDEQ